MSHEENIQRLKEAWREIEPGQDVVIDLFKPEDALGVSLCYYEVYGDSFPIEHVYDPDEVIARNSTDAQYTVVARTPKGELVGLAGLFRHAPNPGVYEAGQLMVLKSYRKSHAAKKIASRIIGELPAELGLPVIFGEAVCNHPVSQRLAHNDGLRPTGLEVECMPSGTYSKEGVKDRNVSLLLMFNVLNDEQCDVYLPEEYVEFLGEMFDTLNMSRNVLTGGELAGSTASDEFLLPDAGLARLTISKPGTDIVSVANAAHDKLGGQGLVQIFLNLGDPGAPEAVALLKEQGYCFAGLLPAWFGSDGLVMQKLPQEPEWDGICLYNKTARAILEYVRKDYESVRKS